MHSQPAAQQRLDDELGPDTSSTNEEANKDPGFFAAL
jgi:hypothetical protein